MQEKLIVNYRVQGHGEKFSEYHSHQEYEIYFFHAGSCRYLIHNQIYDLEPGDILLMDGMALHKPNVAKNSEYVRSVILFPPQWINGILIEMGSMHLLELFQNLHHCLIRTRENNESKQLEEVIYRLADVKRSSELDDIHAETEMKVLLLQALIIVYKLGQNNTVKRSSEKVDKAEHAENIMSYIQENYMHELSLNGIADVLNLSRSYTSRVFKEMTGFTVMEYLMACRLMQVKFLLEMEPDTTLKDIAISCGFKSISHFSRYFREKVGMTAKEYRHLRIGKDNK